MAIQNVLMDLGRVMVHLRYDRAVAAAAGLCVPARPVGLDAFFDRLARDARFAAFERGDITPEHFFAYFRERTGFRGEFEAFVRVWRDVFEPNGPMVAVARDLASRVNLYYASNSNVLHIPYLYEAFPELNMHKDDAISCYLHQVKPQRAFFEKALEKFGVRAEACVFLDDNEQNVRGAEACGIRAVVFRDAVQAQAALRRLLAEA